MATCCAALGVAKAAFGSNAHSSRNFSFSSCQSSVAAMTSDQRRVSARTGFIPGEERSGPRGRQSPLGMQGLPLKVLDQVREHTEALELCVVQKTEEVSCNMGQLRFGRLRKLWRQSSVVEKQLGAAHSRASYGQRIPHVPSPSSAISAILAHAWFKAGQGCNSKETSCNIQALSVTGAFVGKIIEHFEALLTEFATQVLPMFPVGFWATVLETLQKGGDQECGDEGKAILECSSSPCVTRLSSSPDSLMDSFGKFMASSFPALAGGSSHLPSSHPSPRADPSVEGSSPMDSVSTTSPAEGDLEVGHCRSSFSSGVAGVATTVVDSGLQQFGVVGKLSESRRVLVSGIGGGSPVVGVGDAS